VWIAGPKRSGPAVQRGRRGRAFRQLHRAPQLRPSPSHLQELAGIVETAGT